MDERRCRVSDRVVDAAVHELALMCAKINLNKAADGTSPEAIPRIAAELYCTASEAIRTHINLLRMSDGTQPDTFGDSSNKAWFNYPVRDAVFTAGREEFYP